MFRLSSLPTPPLVVICTQLLFAVLWFYAFPLKGRWDYLDIMLELTYYIAMTSAYFYSRYLHASLISIGLGLLSTGLFVDVLDEFTTEPEFWDTFFQGALEISGAVIFAFALFRTHHSLKQELAESNHLTMLHRHMALHDPLTGVPNRILLNEHVTASLQSAAETNTLVGILYIDLNGFKQINDTYGHTFGDSLLRQFTLSIGGCIRSNDMLARIGGDEFIVVMTNLTTTKPLEDTINSIHEQLYKPIVVEDKTLVLKITVGSAVFPFDGNTVEALIKKADAKMYEGKQKLNADNWSI